MAQAVSVKSKCCAPQPILSSNTLNFCSNCGSDQIRLKVPEGDNRPRYCCDNCGMIHYQNPNMVVGCLPIYQDKILLCRRAIEPRKGYWNLPAGFLENGETASEGALRETWEEAHARVDIIRLHAVYDIPHVKQVYLFFLANMPEPIFGSGPESLEVDLFSPEEIPFNDMAFTSSTYAIRQYLAYKDKEFEGVHMGGYVPSKG
ncbi:MAG: NUDIX hydrolase [Bacteroidota bacterium]